MTAVVKVRAADLVERLRRHYIKPGEAFPGGIFLPEVGLNGPVTQQRVDAVHVGFTSASGRILTGHEIKVSRADWRHELDQPHKADRWSDQCHAWYVVAPSTDIVPPEELPHGWGLMVPNPRTTTRMDVKVKAAVRDVTPSWLIVRSIMARYDTLRAAEISAARRKADEAARAEIEEARRELAVRGSAVADGTVSRIAEVIARVNAQTREDSYTGVNDDELVAALVDVVQTRAAAVSLRYELQRIVRDAREMSAPFANAYGALASLLADSAVANA